MILRCLTIPPAAKGQGNYSRVLRRLLTNTHFGKHFVTTFCLEKFVSFGDKLRIQQICHFGFFRNVTWLWRYDVE